MEFSAIVRLENRLTDFSLLIDSDKRELLYLINEELKSIHINSVIDNGIINIYASENCNINNIQENNTDISMTIDYDTKINTYFVNIMSRRQNSKITLKYSNAKTLIASIGSILKD